LEKPKPNPKLGETKQQKDENENENEKKKQVKHSKLSKLLQLAVSHLLFLLLCF